MTTVVFCRIQTTKRQPDILFELDFQYTSGTVPCIVKSAGRIFGENQIAASGPFREIAAFVPFLFLVDGIAEIEILFQRHLDQKNQRVHV